jgi:CheY-like chemotaxis protein
MSGRKIVIIEDNPMNMELAVDVLEAGGYEVLTADNAEEGIRLVKSHLPALVLMDISLPGMDGLDATRVLKGNPATRHIPVIAVTAHAMRGDEQRILDAGCSAYLAKPMDVQALRTEVARLIAPGPSRE